ncbi:Peroxisomal 2,4-dienoyl-CoA reductase [Geodia barretti]|nr:Peroxisomal 2,4-dienoyl-CoA reductase [Geodia barretti]
MAQEGHDDYCLQSYSYRFSPTLLEGRVAFITGGGSGIGFRIAELFMRHGCDTVIASRNLGKLEDAAEQLTKATGRKCLTYQLDVRKYDQICDVVKTLLKNFQRIDILINAAAGNFPVPCCLPLTKGIQNRCVLHDPCITRLLLDIDTVGTFSVTRAVYDLCFKEQGGGVVINITATLHYTGTVLQVHAGSAKAAVDAMTRHLAVEWGPQGVRVNSIAPGPIAGTEGMRRLGGATSAAREFLQQQIPLQRLGTRTDIAEAALYLASDLSSYVTGSVLVVDGGAWMTSGMDLDTMANIHSKL